MLAKPLAVTSAHRYYMHILIVRIPLGKLSQSAIVARNTDWVKHHTVTRCLRKV